jgi:hypothetical protein
VCIRNGVDVAKALGSFSLRSIDALDEEDTFNFSLIISYRSIPSISMSGEGFHDVAKEQNFVVGKFRSNFVGSGRMVWHCDMVTERQLVFSI